MSASRAFIDVLVGKLTAYVDAPSRPAPSILTPAWVTSLAAVPRSYQFVSRAYAGHARPAAHQAAPPPGSVASSCAAHGTAVAADTTGASRAIPWRPATPARQRRTPAERMAIELLRRLGAASLTPTASDEEIRRACRRLLHGCHPDAHPHAAEADRAVLATRLRAVLRARAILDPRRTAHPAAA